MTRRALALAAVLAGIGAAPAAAQVQPPSLTADTTFAFGGVSQYDFGPGTADSGAAAAADLTRDRGYAVGTTGTAAAIIARRSDGTLDPGFAGDGSLELTLGRETDGIDVAVLADGRLRVLVRTDSATTGPADYDTAVVGLLPDGAPDPDFPAQTFASAGFFGDEPTALAVSADGRIAVTGAQGPDGYLIADGVRTSLDLTPGTDEAAVDVAWSGATPVVLLQTGTGAALYSAGGGFRTPLTVPGATSVTAEALVVSGGKLWVAGTTVVAGDSDALLARTDLSGGGLETRRFDMRGSVFPAGQQVTGRALNLVAVPGDPDTLVVSGSSAFDRGAQWAFAAFNGLEGPLDTLAYTDIVLPVVGHTGDAPGLAVQNGAVFAVGSLLDGSTADDSLATARVLIDAEKRCDLALAVISPVELLLRGGGAGDVTVRVINNGRRPCVGAVSVPAPWQVVGGNVTTGRLVPGESVTRTLSLGYAAALPRDATLELTLTAAGDTALGDNVSRVRALFAFCDLALTGLDLPPVIGTEGTRRFAFTVRNVGTAPCTGAQVVAAAPGLRAGTVVPYTVDPGKSVEDELSVGVARGLKTGSRAPLAFRAVAAGDVAGANDTVGATPLVVRPGDTDARAPRGRSFSGRAKRGAGTGVSARTLRVRRVELSVRKLGGGCEWLGSVTGKLRTVDEGPGGRCDAPVWVTAKGTERWSLRLRAKLPKGRYELRTRAVLANGVAEGRFTRGDRNLIRFRVR